MTNHNDPVSSQVFQHKICGEMQNVTVAKLHKRDGKSVFEVSNQYYRHRKEFIVTILCEDEELSHHEIFSFFVSCDYPEAIEDHFRLSPLTFKEVITFPKVEWVK